MVNKTVLFGFLAFFISFGIGDKASAQSFGELQSPIESLGPITELTEQLQTGKPSELTKLIDENDCQRKIVMPESEPPLEAGDIRIAKFSVEISGPGCPITYVVGLTGTQLPDGFQAKLQFQYRAISAEAKALYDVDSTDFEGVLAAEVKQASSGAEIKIDFSYAGHGNSQSKGQFSSASGLKGEMSIGVSPLLNIKIDGNMEDFLIFDFQAKKAELRSKMGFSGLSAKSEYSVNGVAVSADEYKKLRDVVKLPGMDMEAPGLGAPEPKTLECKAEVFKATEFSLTDANQWIVTGGTRPAPVKTSRSCGGVFVDSGSIENLSYNATFFADQNYASVQVQMCEPASSCELAERVFLPDESMKFADTLMSRFTIITSCEVVPECVPRPAAQSGCHCSRCH